MAAKGGSKANENGPDLMVESDALAILRIRYWHHLLNEMLKRKQFRIPIHLGFGHEAAAVAMDRAMCADDKLCLSHRNVAYNLARARSPETILEHYKLLLPSATGAHMGSMNLAIEETGIAYTSSILGNNLAVAAGIAMNHSLIRKAGVIFVVTGDGAMEEGIFWETLIFSRSHRLPVVIVVENNDCSMSSTIEQRRSGIDLKQVCAGVGLQYFKAPGAIFPKVKAALDAARESAAAGVPACVELSLSTFCQHAGPTPGWPGDPRRIDIHDGLLVEDSPRDPLHHIRSTLGASDFLRLSEQVIEAGHRE